MSPKNLAASVITLAAIGALLAAPASAASLKVKLGGIGAGKPIPPQYAFCIPAEQGHVSRGPDKNPKLSWSKGPSGTKSYAVIASDPDVPTIRTDMNQEGKTLPADMPRRTFYHWVLVDIPARTTSIAEGADADGAVLHGKPPGPTKLGVRGINDYTAAFASNEQMKGNYGGYDGPCPPWNDLRLHHYHFTVYALDVTKLDLPPMFGGAEAIAAMKGHILAQGDTIGTYALNPSLPKSAK
jgi:Raf kinase inhibitor-like YbhB/YbcL family protein